MSLLSVSNSNSSCSTAPFTPSINSTDQLIREIFEKIEGSLIESYLHQVDEFDSKSTDSSSDEEELTLDEYKHKRTFKWLNHFQEIDRNRLKDQVELAFLKEVMVRTSTPDPRIVNIGLLFKGQVIPEVTSKLSVCYEKSADLISVSIKKEILSWIPSEKLPYKAPKVPLVNFLTSYDGGLLFVRTAHGPEMNSLYPNLRSDAEFDLDNFEMDSEFGRAFGMNCGFEPKVGSFETRDERGNRYFVETKSFCNVLMLLIFCRKQTGSFELSTAVNYHHQPKDLEVAEQVFEANKGLYKDWNIGQISVHMLSELTQGPSLLELRGQRKALSV